ncbi:putative reverse transcriptase domain-containing protein [Tanacetum coccineum]|uniref:Reverse transcriptase domain-containing protein n=1 Tax=Tanacetum coccineum TaxID=301880 RepID=A0ABQ4Z7C8_9ASTR
MSGRRSRRGTYGWIESFSGRADACWVFLSSSYGKAYIIGLESQENPSTAPWDDSLPRSSYFAFFRTNYQASATAFLRAPSLIYVALLVRVAIPSLVRMLSELVHQHQGSFQHGSSVRLRLACVPNSMLMQLKSLILQQEVYYFGEVTQSGTSSEETSIRNQEYRLIIFEVNLQGSSESTLKENGIHMDLAKIESIKDWASPKTATKIHDQSSHASGHVFRPGPVRGCDRLFVGTKYIVFTDHKSLQHILDQKELNMRQRRWLELLSDYDCEIRYHSGKANVVANALSKKERIKPLPIRALVMTIGLDLPKQILEA